MDETWSLGRLGAHGGLQCTIIDIIGTRIFRGIILRNGGQGDRRLKGDHVEDRRRGCIPLLPRLPIRHHLDWEHLSTTAPRIGVETRPLRCLVCATDA